MESNSDARSKGQVSVQDSGSQVGVDELADQLSALARDLQGEDDVEGMLQAIVDAAVDTLPGAQHASISAVIGRREVYTRASTHDLRRAVDQPQYETGQGPCLQTLYEEETVRLTDMASEQRWTEFTKRAAELGVGSVLSVQLFVAGDEIAH